MTFEVHLAAEMCWITAYLTNSTKNYERYEGDQRRTFRISTRGTFHRAEQNTTEMLLNLMMYRVAR